MTDDGNYIYAMCGNLKEEIDGCRAKIYKYDYQTGKCVKEISCKKDFFSGSEMKFDVKELSKSVCNTGDIIVGKIKAPTYKEGNLNFESIYDTVDISEYKKSDDEECFENGLPVIVRIVGDLLQIYGRDHLVKKVYLYNENEMYEQDFSDTEQKSKIFIKQKYYVNVPLDRIKNGSYNIALNIEDKIYTTEYFVKKYFKNM